MELDIPVLPLVLTIFGLAEGVALVMVIIIRYHLQTFALQDDPAAKRIARIGTVGVVIGVIGAAVTGLLAIKM